MNWVITGPKIEAAGGGAWNMLALSWNDQRPVIPAPHQIIVELWNTIFMVAPWKVKSLVYHGWVTVSSTLLGFVLRHVAWHRAGHRHRAFEDPVEEPDAVDHRLADDSHSGHRAHGDRGAGPIGFTGLVPKSLISMYLCFFPVTIGMVKGLTSPEVMQLDLMRTYHASTSQVLWKLRFPASVPFLFASLKVAVAIALTGAIVGELPTGAVAGIGARLLNGSYYGQTVQIWAALFAASFMAAALGLAGRLSSSA